MAAPRDGSRRTSIRLRPDLGINGFQVFSATMYAQRAQLGETVTAWITAHPAITPVEMTVVQSSDAAFHCVTIVVGYWEARPARPARSAR